MTIPKPSKEEIARICDEAITHNQGTYLVMCMLRKAGLAQGEAAEALHSARKAAGKALNTY